MCKKKFKKNIEANLHILKKFKKDPGHQKKNYKDNLRFTFYKVNKKF